VVLRRRLGTIARLFFDDGGAAEFAANVESVAYFSAYGDYHMSPQEVAGRHRELITLDHHWGFGLLKRHWLSLQDRLRDYYDVVVGTDYTRRDHRRIFSIYEAAEAAPRASSQDAAKAFACDQLGLWRCNTLVPFARYIGATGQHMTPELFKDLGYDNAFVSQAPVMDLQLPGPSGIREKVLEQRHLFETVRREELAGIIAKLPPMKLNPMRLCTRGDVIAAYDLLLRRSVENEQIILEHLGTRPVQTLVSAIIKSSEFDDLVEKIAKEFTFRDATSRRLCSAQDIRDVYALLCHREPESEIIARHEGSTHIDLLVEGVVRSPEFRALQQQFVP